MESHEEGKKGVQKMTKSQIEKFDKVKEAKDEALEQDQAKYQ